jgi:hypothetical protein
MICDEQSIDAWRFGTYTSSDHHGRDELDDCQEKGDYAMHSDL